MKNKTVNIFNFILGLVAIFFIVSLFLAAIQYLGRLVVIAFEQIASISSKTDAVIVVAMITGGISIITVIISSVIAKIIEFNNETKRYLYEKREKPYSDFINMVYKLQLHAKNKIEYSDEQMLQDISKFSENLTLWGSNNVIKKWLKIRNSSKENIQRIDTLFILEEIIYEIRKDMGQKKNKLKKGDILAFFVNDVENYLQSKK